METNNAAPDAPTPETDALDKIMKVRTMDEQYLIDFARTLERDRNRLVALIGQMRQAISQQDWDEFNLLIEAAYEKP